MGALRIVFMGTPAFAAVALKALIDGGHDVIAAYSQPPRPKGRGLETQKSPVHAFAEELGIAVRTPASLKGADEIAAFAALQRRRADPARHHGGRCGDRRHHHADGGGAGYRADAAEAVAADRSGDG